MTTHNFWKPSEESGIASEDKVFFVARLKLTALYVGILSVIVLGFSLFIYEGVYHNLQDSGDDDFAGALSHQHFVAQAIHPIQDTLIFSDVLILVITAILSYFLAGRTLRPVQRSLEAQRLFSAEASHELRTPLAIMRNDIEVLLRSPRPSGEQMREILVSNAEEIQKMSNIVEDLLVLARSEHAGLSFESSVNIHELVGSVVEKMRTIAAQKDLEIQFSGDSTMFVRANPNALERAFLNIIQNSIDHTSTGKIMVHCERIKQSVRVSIEDSGSGISGEELPHVFTRFYKGRYTQGKGGTGLGLAIVKEIVEQHKGTVLIKSTPAVGTTVSLSLPLA
jgi:two-component system sensor histidine kinase CiaH